MTDKILCIVHQATSDTGRVGRVLRELGYEVETTCPRREGPLPPPETLAGAVMFGGPMSANDHDMDPGLRAEIDWLEAALAAGTPFVGICLGAQMLAKVLGSTVAWHPEDMHEIGYVPVTPTKAWCDCMPEPMYFYQWHKETFDLPRGAVLLAEGDRYPNQAFRYGDKNYGIQFHPEVTREIMLRWAGNAGDRLERPEVQGLEQQMASNERYEPQIEAWTRRFLAEWLGAEWIDADEAGAAVAAAE
ncbi:MAG: glutamine amidotransferase [Proteobacteria bacterium]|nr:glutamine amidotransferase [Pseudomonadota bacterium]